METTKDRNFSKEPPPSAKKAKSQNVGSLWHFNISWPKLHTQSQRIRNIKEFFRKLTHFWQFFRNLISLALKLGEEYFIPVLCIAMYISQMPFGYKTMKNINNDSLNHVFPDFLLFPCSSVAWVGSDGFSYFWWIILINCYWQLHWKTIAICFPFLTFFYPVSHHFGIELFLIYCFFQAIYFHLLMALEYYLFDRFHILYSVLLILYYVFRIPYSLFRISYSLFRIVKWTDLVFSNIQQICGSALESDLFLRQL